MKSIDIRSVNKYTGYKNYGDVTSLAPTDIIAGSQNVFIEDGVKLATRGGSRYFGAPGTVGVNTNPSWVLAHRIHSDYDKFVNNQGTIMPFRVYYSGTTAQGDVLEVWLPDFIAGAPQATKRWYQVNATAPSVPILSTHKWYFAEWYDPLNVQNRIVFTYGTNLIGSYTGGYAPVTAVTGTTITTNGTWESKGYISAPEGVDSVVVNGVTYALTSGDFSTNTITVASTAGISVNDVAFQSLNSDTASFGVADFCSALNNQVYYEDWIQRNVFVSWNRNRNAFLGDTTYTGTSGLDDAVFGGTFTGTSTDTFIVSIDSVDPATQTQTFTGTGINDIFFNTGGYTGASGENTYTVSMVADAGFTFVGVPAITPAPGDILVGSVSNAVGRVAFLDGGGQDPALVMLSPQGFVPGDVISGPQGTPYGTVFSVVGVNWFQLFKNDNAITPTAYAPFIAYQMQNAFNPVAFVDGLSFSFQSENGHRVGDFWTLTINSGGPDTFSWSQNGTTGGSLIPITGGAQALNDGVTVNFVNTTGHAVGDSWRMIAYQLVQKGWRDFYYTQPVRLPGEGFIIQLDSNGYSMSPQEEHMYIVSNSGEYYTTQPQLSSDLQSETFLTKRLKTEQQNKPLFPYLMAPTKNYITIVSTEKTWDVLGRQKFLELPQSKTFSDLVRVDFQTADWEDGNSRYINRKTYFVRPRQGDVLVYDEFTKFWHAPMVFGRRISSIGFIDGKIIGHSYDRNESYEIFTVDRNDLDIYPLNVRIITPYIDYGDRFQPKASTAIAFDGYMEGNPHIKWRVNAGIGGCDGFSEGEIDPIMCVPTDTASLGKSSLGFHGLGNSPTNVINHFHYGRTFSDISYYLRNIEITCDQPDQRWAITTHGTNVDITKLSNTTMFNK